MKERGFEEIATPQGTAYCRPEHRRFFEEAAHAVRFPRGGSVTYSGFNYFGKMANGLTKNEVVRTVRLHSAYPDIAAEFIGVFVPNRACAEPHVFFAGATGFVDLETFLASLESLPDKNRRPRLMKIAKLVGHATGCAHTLQTHGDLLPRNILVSHSRTLVPRSVKIVDWEFSADRRRMNWAGSTYRAQSEGNPVSDLRRLYVWTAWNLSHSSYPLRKAFLKAYYAARRGRLTKKTGRLIERLAGKGLRV